MDTSNLAIMANVWVLFFSMIAKKSASLHSV